MGLFNAIFGDSKNADVLVDGAVKGLDKIVFTEEERSDANQRLSQWYLEYLAATHPQNLARRLIALIIVGVWAFLILTGVAVWRFDQEYSRFIFQTLREIIMEPFLVVIGFYFLAHVVRTYQREKGKAES